MESKYNDMVELYNNLRNNIQIQFLLNLPLKNSRIIVHNDGPDTKNNNIYYIAIGSSDTQTVKGWAIDSEKESDFSYVIAKCADRYYLTEKVRRPDVVKAFKGEKNYEYCGYRVQIPTKSLEKSDVISFICISKDMCFRHEPVEFICKEVNINEIDIPP